MKNFLLSITLFVLTNVNAQNVNIPDPSFKAYLVSNLSINTNADAEIQVSEAIAYTGTINCNSMNISDLTGIEAFTGIRRLYCDDNLLTSLDVSQNTALDSLTCAVNDITYLDVSQNTALIALSCGGNEITTLDVSQNSALSELGCWSNQIVTLDLSQNAILSGLGCSDNLLTSLDLSQNGGVILLYCDGNLLECLNVKNGNNSNFIHFEATYNSSLTCITVDDVAWSNTNWTNIDLQTSFSTNCGSDCSATAAINELSKETKEIVAIVDFMGRETLYKPNTPLIYIYSDGTRERVLGMEN